MARSRNIKPSLFKNELLGVADPMLTILFSGLWCLADRAGRLEDRPLRIKAEIFPYRENTNINVYLTELERLGFIHRYSVDGLNIIQVVNFDKHQNPHKTERPSELPEYSLESDSCEITVKHTLNDVEITEAAGLIPDSLNLIPDSRFPITDTPAKAVVIDFDLFWNIYPKKIGREESRKAWKKLKPNQSLFDLIKTHLSYAYIATDKQFIPNGSTYLNQKRWTDEVITTAKPINNLAAMNYGESGDL